jgi:hypothetical protein
MKALVDSGFEKSAALEPLVDENLPLHQRVLGVRQIGPASRLPSQPREPEEPLDAGQGEMMVCRHLNIVTKRLRGVNGVLADSEVFLPETIHCILPSLTTAILDADRFGDSLHPILRDADRPQAGGDHVAEADDSRRLSGPTGCARTLWNSD